MHDQPPGSGMTFEAFQRQMAAQFERVIQIGTMVFGERAEPPPPPGPLILPVSATAEPSAPPPAPTFIKQLPERCDLDTARARLPFTLPLPGWVPEGFEHLPEVSLTGPGLGRSEDDAGQPVALGDLPAINAVHLAWRHADGRGFNYAVSYWPQGNGRGLGPGILPVPRGAVQAVTVNDLPAALLTSTFYLAYPSRETGVQHDARLMWDAGRLHYQLLSFLWPEAGDTLVAIAASIPRPA